VHGHRHPLPPSTCTRGEACFVQALDAFATA
jgi:hypothetical protein